MKYITMFASSATIVLAVVCCILAITKKVKQSIFAYYILLCAAAEIINFYGAYADKQTLMLIPFFSFFELLLMINYFKTQFPAKNLKYCVIIAALLAIVDIFIIYNYQNGSIFVISRVCNAIVLIALAMYSIYTFDLPQRIVRLNFSIIFYFSLTFFHFLLLNLLINLRVDLIFIIWIVYSIACLVFNLLLFFDSWKFGKILKL